MNGVGKKFVAFVTDGVFKKVRLFCLLLKVRLYWSKHSIIVLYLDYYFQF